MNDRDTIPNTLAIIPARGGSKGLPRKNVRMLGNMPLIAYTIRAAVQSRVERVIVSTDDPEIAEVSRQYGAEVPFVRPAEYSSDTATSLAVLQHALSYMEGTGMKVDHVVFLQPTSPFRNSTHLDEALARYFQVGATSLIGVTDVQEFHPYFMFTINHESVLRPLFDLENRPLRRQDLPSFYRINGAIYITKRDYYNNLSDGSAIFDWSSLAAYPMDAPSSVDINDYLDFQKAELMLQKETGSGQ